MKKLIPVITMIMLSQAPAQADVPESVKSVGSKAYRIARKIVMLPVYIGIGVSESVAVWWMIGGYEDQIH